MRLLRWAIPILMIVTVTLAIFGFAVVFGSGIGVFIAMCILFIFVCMINPSTREYYQENCPDSILCQMDVHSFTVRNTGEYAGFLTGDIIEYKCQRCGYIEYGQTGLGA